MGKATNRKPKTKTALRSFVPDEALGHGEFEGAGLATRRVPVIDTMRRRQQISNDTYVRLAFYRDQASLADRTLTKSCLDFSVKGAGDIPISAAVTSAMLTTARIERDLGSLLPIARAIAVDDVTLTDWCVSQHGGRERYDGRGKFVAIVPVREKKVMAIAMMDLRVAATRIIQ